MNNNNQNNNNQKSEFLNIQQEFNVLRILKRMIDFWPYYVIAIFTSLTIAFIYNKYSTPVFRCSSTILIKQDKKGSSSGLNPLLQGFDLFNYTNPVQNEIFILQSFNLNKKTIQDLKLYITYSKKNIYGKNTELYNNVPFKIIFNESDTTIYQTINLPIKINILDTSFVELYFEIDDEAYAFNYLTNDTKKVPLNKTIKRKIRWGELYSDEYFTFQVIPTFDLKKDIENFNKTIYTVEFKDINRVTSIYRSRLKVEQINKDATILKVTMQDNIISRAIDYINKLCENYIMMGLEEKNLTATKTIEFIDSQLQLITDSLNRIEFKLEDFRKTNKIADLSYQGRTIFEKLQQTEYERSLLAMQVNYYEYLLNYVKTENVSKDLIAPSAIGINDPLLNNLIIELSKLYTQREQLKTTSSEKNPYYNQLTTQINTIQKTLIENVTNIYQNARNNLKEKDKVIFELQGELSNLPKTERELIGIQRKYNVNDQIYTFLLQKRAESAIAQASNIANNSVLDDARFEAKVKPKSTTNYLIAIILAFLLPTIGIIIIDLLQNTVRDLSEIEELTNLPIVGNIIHYEDSQNLAIDNPNAAILESFRAIRTNLDFFVPGKERKIIAISSMTSGEGKSFISFHLAIVFALANKKTLLIGSDIRKPDVGKFFKMKLDKGLSTFLIKNCEWNDIVFHSSVENLDFIPAGPIPPNPAELLSPETINQINELTSNYEIVIYDTSPIGIFSDAAYILKFADVVLFVTRYGYSKRIDFKNIHNIIEKLDLKHVGLLCNDMQKKHSRYYYYNYYYNRYYYSRYYYYDKSKKRSSE